MKKLIALGWVLTATQAVAGGVPADGFISVGPGECDYATIQAAIDDGSKDINITQGVYAETLIISDLSIDVKGGFVDCDAAEHNIRTPGSRSHITPDSGPALVILADTEGIREAVDLIGLDVSGGEPAGFIPSGGMTVAGDVIVSLFDSSIHGNTGILGGGAYAQEPAALFVRNSQFSGNTAVAGGGIYCSGCDLTLDRGTGVVFNEATGNETYTGDGGGVYINDTAQALIMTGSTQPAVDLLGIYGNNADRYGGGMYIAESSVIVFGNGFLGLGDYTNPASITHNYAGEEGGGVMLEGTATLEMLGIDLSHNEADRSGAAMTVQFGATLNIHAIDLFADETCWHGKKQQCNRISHNEIVGNDGNNHYGGAIRSAMSDLSIANTWFEGNSLGGNDRRGSVLFAESGSTLIRNTVMYQNGHGSGTDRNVLDVFSGDFNMYHVTIVDNLFADQMIRVYDTDTDEFNIANSILHDVNGLPVFNLQGGDMFYAFSCLIVHEQVSFAGLGSAINVQQGEPNFFNRTVGDFNLYSASNLAVDQCAEVLGMPDFDLNLSFRDIDVFGMGEDESLFIHDMGAIEYQGDDDLLDVIFSDGFNPMF